MFRKLIISKNNNIEDFVKFFYKESEVEPCEYSICRKTGLSYLGEFFERYERESINPLDIVHGIACGTTELPEHQIYQGQLEGFLERLELIMNSNNDFLDKLTYIIFLKKLGFEDKSQFLLQTMIDNLELDLNFLALTLSIASGNLDIDDDMRSSIVNLLNDKQLNLDCLSVADSLNEKIYSLDSTTELVGLRYIEKAYSLKAKDIKDTNRFKFYKSLKKIGTKSLVFDDVKEFINLSEQEFYFVSIKIANETYVKGYGLYSANEHLLKLLEPSIDVNSKLYPYLVFLGVPTAKEWKESVKISKLDFNNIKKEYYEEFAKVYTKNKTISYEKYKNLVDKEEFIEFICSLDYESYKHFKNNISLKVIAFSNDKEICDKYFTNFKNLDDIGVNETFILIDKGYVNLKEFIEESVVGVNGFNLKYINLYYGINGSNNRKLSSYTKVISNYNLENIAMDLVYYFLENEVRVEYVTYGGLSAFIDDIYNIALKKCYKTKDKNLKAEYLRKIDDFVFMYDSPKYVGFLIDMYKDEDMNAILEISEDEIKEICKRTMAYVKQSPLEDKIKEILLSETEFFVDECKKAFDAYIEVDWNFLNYDYNHLFDIFIECFKKCDKSQIEEVVDYIKMQMINTKKEDFKRSAVKHLERFVNNEVLEKSDALEILESYF